MADCRRLVDDSKRQESDDSSLSEEWMLIDDTEDESKNNKVSTSFTNSNDKDNDDNDENMQNHDTDTSDEKPDEDKNNSDDSVEKSLDDSDGISIITESDNEATAIRKEISNINDEVNVTSHSRSVIQEVNQADDKTVSQVGTIFNVIVACSLAAVIGLGAGRILSIDECTISNDVDFASVKMKNDFLINQLKELNDVRDVLDEIKASIPKVASGDRKESDSYYDDVTNGNVNLNIVDKSSKSDRNTKINEDLKIVERLKDSLENLCSVIDDIVLDKSRSFTTQLCQSQHVIKDLMIFEKIISKVLRDSTEETLEIRILQNAEEKINNVCRSLLFDLSNSVHVIATKIYHKLEKVHTRMNEKLCTLRKEGNSEFFKKLPINNNFLANCERMTNVTRDFEKSAKVDGVTKRSKNKSKSKRRKSEFVKREFYDPPEEDTCPSLQIPWFASNYQNDIKLDQKLDSEDICASGTGANDKKFKAKKSDKISKGLNTVHVKSSKNMWNKRIRDSKRSKKDIKERRNAKILGTSENLEDHSKDTYASKVKCLNKKMEDSRKESDDSGWKQKARSDGETCLKQKRTSEQTGDDKQFKDFKSSSKKSKRKERIDRRERPKMEKQLPKDEHRNKDTHDGEWQLQRSKAREILRDRERASDWYFDRAVSRRDARNDEAKPEAIDDNYDKEWEDFLIKTKDARQFGKRNLNLKFSSKTQKRFTYKTHRQNIMKERRR